MPKTRTDERIDSLLRELFRSKKLPRARKPVILRKEGWIPVFASLALIAIGVFYLVPPPGVAGQPNQEGKDALPDSLIVNLGCEKIAVVTDPKVAVSFFTKFKDLSLIDPNIGLKSSGVLLFRRGGRTIREKKLFPEYGVRSTPERKRFFQELNDILQKHPASTDQLLSCLNVENRHLRFTAGFLLGSEGTEHIPCLIQAYEKFTDPGTRSIFLNNVLDQFGGKTRDEKHRELLFETFQRAAGEGTQVRIAALRALARHFPKRSHDILTRKFNHSNPKIRQDALMMVTYIKDPEAAFPVEGVREIILRLNDPELWVRNRAMFAIEAQQKIEKIPFTILAIPSLIRVLQDQEDGLNHDRAAKVLRAITKKDHGVSAFVQGPSHDEERQRQAIAQWEIEGKQLREELDRIMDKRP